MPESTSAPSPKEITAPPLALDAVEGPSVKRDQMPRRMVFVRHGESEANIINRMFKKGEISEYPEVFLNTPDREIRLTASGRMQASATGPWLAAHYPDGFDKHFVSDHARAMETAGIALSAAGWHDVELLGDPLLGERCWGSFSLEPEERRRALMELRHRDPLQMAMPNGELLLTARHRTRERLERASRKCAGKDILIITHGEYIEAIWSEIAHWGTEQQVEFFGSEDGDLKNCQVVEFAAENPFTGEWDGSIRWYRSSCPQAGILGEWKPLPRTKYTPEDLLESVQKYPHFLE